jgi:hypothetical protein
MPRLPLTPFLFFLRHFEIHRDCRRRRLPRHSRFWASAGQETQISSAFQISNFIFAMPSLHAPNVGDVPVKKPSRRRPNAVHVSERGVQNIQHCASGITENAKLVRRSTAQNIKHYQQTGPPHPPQHTATMPRLRLSSTRMARLIHNSDSNPFQAQSKFENRNSLHTHRNTPPPRRVSSLPSFSLSSTFLEFSSYSNRERHSTKTYQNMKLLNHGLSSPAFIRGQ